MTISKAHLNRVVEEARSLGFYEGKAQGRQEITKEAYIRRFHGIEDTLIHMGQLAAANAQLATAMAQLVKQLGEIK